MVQGVQEDASSRSYPAAAQDMTFQGQPHLHTRTGAERVNSTATDDALLDPMGVGADEGPGMRPAPIIGTRPQNTEPSQADPKLFPEVRDTSAKPERTHSRRGWPLSFNGLTPHHVKEHPGFKRNKLTLLSMGIAVVLVANVTFLGFLTPPKSPAMPLLYFDLPSNQKLDGVSNNGFVNLILNKTASRDSAGALALDRLDYSKLSLSDYAAMFRTIDQNDFCPYPLQTAFLVFNGFAFSFGAISMTITLVFFVVAFLLAGFVTAGVGQPSPVECDYVTSESKLLRGVIDGSVADGTANIFVASVYATLGMICVLLVLIEIDDSGLVRVPIAISLLKGHFQDVCTGRRWESF
ncbi:hypothetical protein WJX74_002103 [Apatococcus lobatus]|uniref:Uncharacterized protein n=2 Tax=Apatococcus TaxID=904362 RepID=A0AAW1T825_9CHLO